MFFSQLNFNENFGLTKNRNVLKSEIKSLFLFYEDETKIELFDELIEIISIEFKKNLKFLQKNENFEKIYFFLVYKLSSETFLSINDSFFFIENYLAGFNDNKVSNTYSDIQKLKFEINCEIEENSYFFLTSMKLAHNYIKTIKNKNNFYIFDIDNHINYFIVNPLTKFSLMNHFFYSFFYLLTTNSENNEVEMIISLLFNNLLNNNDNEIIINDGFKALNHLELSNFRKKYAFNQILKFSTFTNCIFNSICHYRAFNDPSSLSLLEGLYEQFIDVSKENDENITQDTVKQIEDLLFNCKTKDIQIKTENTIKVISLYIKIVLKKEDRSILSSVLSFIFTYLYLQTHHKKTLVSNSTIKSSKKYTFNIILKYLYYSLFALDFIKLNKEFITKEISDNIKYVCLFNYMEYSGKISSQSVFASLASCYFIKEIISSFNFNSAFPKALFNYLCYIYQIQHLYPSKSNFFSQFIIYINELILNNKSILNNITQDNDWSYLFMSKYDIIPELKIPIFQVIDINITVHLKSIIKKIKHVHIFEKEILLLYIDKLISDQNYHSIIVKNKEVMNMINKSIAYLLFNNDFIAIDILDSNFFNVININTLLFNIMNKLLIEQPYEFFYFPKNKDIYLSFDKFLKYISEKNKKILQKNSIISYEVLTCEYNLNKYFNNENNIKENDNLGSFLYINLYYKRTMKDDQKKNLFSCYGLKLIEIFNFSLNKNESDIEKKKEILLDLINSDEYHLKIAYYVLYSALTSISCPYILIINYFEMLINSDKKYHLYYIVSLIKFFDSVLWVSIEKKESEIRKNKNINIHLLLKTKTFNSNCSSDFKNKFQFLFNLNDNWSKIKKILSDQQFFHKISLQLHKRNFPITCINIIEKTIYDTMREKNITSITRIADKELIRVYAKCLNKIGDNGKLLHLYFLNKSLYNEIIDNTFTFGENVNLSNLLQDFFISCDLSIIKSKSALIGNSQNSYHITRFVIIIRYIVDLLYNKFYIRFQFKLNETKMYIISSVAQYLNKTVNENYGNSAFTIILYEISQLISAIENSCDIKESINNVNIQVPNKKIKDIIKDIIVNRRLPYMSKYLLHFKTRRLLCYLCKEKVYELVCIRDIVKTLKKSTSNRNNNNYEIISYLSVYRKLLVENYEKNKDLIDLQLIYICLKYHFIYCDGQFDEFDLIYKLYLKKCNMKSNPKFEALFIKNKERLGISKVEINNELFKFISSYISSSLSNDNESFCSKAHIFLSNFYTINQSKFNMIKTDNSIYQITIDKIDICIFDYIKIAIMICIKSINENQLVLKYLPEIVNYFYKIQLAFINSSNIQNNQTIKKKILFEENLNLMKIISVDKLRCILSQIIISYSYPKTPLYDLSVSLLSSYGEKNIDRVAFLLSAFLSSNPEDNKYFVSSVNKHSSILNKFAENIKLGQNFAEDVKSLLSESNKKIVESYVQFQKKLKDFFLILKKKSGESEKTKFNMMLNTIDDINLLLLEKNIKIILPNLENMNNYNPKVREMDLNESFTDPNENKKKNKKRRKNASKNNTVVPTVNNSLNIIDDKTLYICEMESNFEVLESKEKPLKIRFKACLYHENAKTAKNPKYFTFLLKGDLQDISKELKTFELFNEINNLLQIKHYDINHSMKLRRYLITPITTQIVLAEWLLNSEPLYSILFSLIKKNCIDINILKNEKDSSLVRKNAIKNLPESYNLLYQYIHHKNPNPNDWYNYQNNFCISTAVWSMTGFLVGLGDRHPGNIMLCSTGEVVHIDFGYVLGKGRALPVPEIVDFRFTKNIRRSLGLFEENGLFIYICKKMIEMFKEYYTMLRGRLEYFAFDPFFIKDSDRETFNTLNEMNCFFGEDFNYQNSDIKVYQLILKNKNENKLEQMFIGWSPML